MLNDSVITYLREKYSYYSDLNLNITEITQHKTHVHVKFYMFDKGQKITSSGWMYHQELDILTKDILMCDRMCKIKDILR